MSLSRYPQITEELLSAYLDDLVSEEERQMVEQAAADDPQIAWQLASLQQTVALLQNLSTLALPRSFAINAAMLDAHGNRQLAVAVAPQERATARESWWQKLVAALQGGNAPLRNAATAAAILLVILVAGSWLLSPNRNAQQIAMNTASVDATVDTPVDTSAPSAQSDNSATQEVATAEIVTALAAAAPQANPALKQPAAASTQTEAAEQPATESIQAEADESPTAVAPAQEAIAMARVTTSDAEGTTAVEPTATVAQVIAAAVPEEPQITTESDGQRAATTASTIQSAPLAAAGRPSGDDTQPLDGVDAAPMAFQAPTDNLTTDTVADSPTGTMQPPATVAETPENNSAIASAPAAIDETAHGISAAAAATMEENTTTDGQPTAVADSTATKSAQENQPVATPTAIEIDDTSTISLTAAADLTVTLATTATELTATVPLSEQLTITMGNSITDTDTVITDTVINTGTIAITNTVMVTDTPMLSPTVTVTPTITVSPTMTLTERSLITSTISVPLLSESHSVTATRSAESTKLAPLTPTESITATATSVKPEPTVTKTATRRATAATVTPLHTPVAPPEVTPTATMTVTLTATLTATSTPTMTTTPTATGTITATPLITGTLTPAAISLGQQPIIMVMNATGAVEQSGQSMFHWMIQLLLSLLVMTWITLWWRRETTISRLQHTMQPVTKHEVEQKEEHA